MKGRSPDSLPLDGLDPFEMEGTSEDIAMVEHGLAQIEDLRSSLARKQRVWTAVVEGWKKSGTPHRDAKPEQSSRAQSQKSVSMTVGALAEVYTTDKRSPYFELRHSTRENYSSVIKRLLDHFGSSPLADMRVADIELLYGTWASAGKLTMARSLVSMLRMMVGFGATILDDPECQRISGIVRSMRFEVVKPRTERMTAEQARAICDKAFQMGLRPIGFAQAFQFDCGMRQKDVIGEWVPHSDEGDPKGILDGSYKWLRGLRWEEIDQDFVMTHTASKHGEVLQVSLRDAPLVMAELRRYLGVSPQAEITRDMFPATGAVVICDPTRLPYTNTRFRREWRRVADATGLPKSVRNQDSARGGSDDDDDDTPEGDLAEGMD